MTDPRIIQSFEEYLFSKGDLMRFSKTELDKMPLSKLQHFIGFILGERDLQEQQQQEQQTRQKYQNFKKSVR